MGLSLTRADHPAKIVEQTVRLSLGAVVGIWIARRLALSLALLVRSPFALFGVAIAGACGFFVVEVGPWPLVEVAVIVIGVGIVFRVKWPEVFGQVVGFPMRSRLRGAAIYRLRWTKAMETAGLAVTSNGTSYVPTLGKVRSTLNVDRVRVRMLPGQTIDDYAKVADRLAQTFAAEACRVHSVPKKLHDVELWLLIDDPLQQLVVPAPARVEWLEDGLPIARGEDGLMWPLRLIGSHVLVVGATGAGKGSVIWSVLAASSPPSPPAS